MGDYDFYMDAVKEMDKLGRSISNNIDKIVEEKKGLSGDAGKKLSALKDGGNKLFHTTRLYSIAAGDFMKDPLNIDKVKKFNDANKKTDDKTPIDDSLSLSNQIRDFLKADDFSGVKEEKGKNLYEALFSLENIRSFQVLHNAMNDRVNYIWDKNHIMNRMNEKLRGTESTLYETEGWSEEQIDVVKDYSKIKEQLSENRDEIEKTEQLLKELNEDLSERGKNIRYRKIKEQFDRYNVLDEKYREECASLEKEILRSKIAVESAKLELRDILSDMQKIEEENARLEKDNKVYLQQIEESERIIQENTQIQSVLSGHQNENFADEMDEATKKSIEEVKNQIAKHWSVKKENKHFLEENRKTLASNLGILENLNNKKKNFEEEMKLDSDKAKEDEEKLRQASEVRSENQKRRDKQELLYRTNDADYEKKKSAERNRLMERLEKLQAEQKILKKTEDFLEKSAGKFQDNYKGLQEVYAERKAFRAPNFEHYFTEMSTCVKTACKKFSDYYKKDAEKFFKNNDEYSAMLTALESAEGKRPEEICDFLNELKQKAMDYKEAKAKQWRPFPSTVRVTRLAMADGVIAYCDQMTKQYETLAEIKKPVAFTKEEAKLLKETEDMLRRGDMTPEATKKEIINHMNKTAQEIRTNPMDDGLEISEFVEEMEETKTKQQTLGK